MNPSFQKFRQLVKTPIRFNFFLLKSLPAAFFAGLKIKSFDADMAVIKVRYNWFTKNPFRSMYFAVEAMAAELSTGLLVFGQVYQRNPAISMLVVKTEAIFLKKATGSLLFTCEQGQLVQDTIAQAIVEGTAKTMICTSIGKNEAGEEVAQFHFTWSIKAKK